MTSITCCALRALKSKEVEIAGEYRDVARAEIGHHFRRMLQRRETEERCRRNAAQGPLHRTEALFDLFLALIFGQLLVGQRRVRPGVRTDGMARSENLLQDFRIVGRMLADRKENSGGAFVGQRLQHRGGVDRPRAIVKCQHDFVIAQEIELLEVFEAESGAAGGVDFNHAGYAERVGIGTRQFRCAWRRRGRRRGGGLGSGCLRRRCALGGRGLRPCGARAPQSDGAREKQACHDTHFELSLRSRARRWLGAGVRVHLLPPT